MSGIDRDRVRHVARLARLELDEDEVERLAGELERALSRFREIEAAEGAGGEEGEAPESEAVGDDTEASRLRPDRPDADTLARGPEEMAPEWKDGFFLVPRLEALGGDG